MTKYKLTPRLRSGVTLIELILVLAISSFMIVLALGGLTNRGRVQFDDGVNQVFNELRQVQNEAVNGQGKVDTGNELFGKGVNFSTTNPSKYEYYTIRRPVNTGIGNSAFNNYFIEVQPPTSTRQFPQNVKLIGIKLTDLADTSLDPVSTPGVIYESTITKGIIVFARGEASGGVVSGQVRNTAFPHFINQSGIEEAVPVAGQCGGSISCAKRADNYSSPQSFKIILTFQNPDNAGMTANILINTATGTMEIKK